MEEKENNHCEWCGKHWPKGFYPYYEINVFQQDHEICGDCYKRLKKST